MPSPSVFGTPGSNPNIAGQAVRDPQSIQYLAFKGGGGKGIAYLGAIRVLEDPKMNLLPVNTGRVQGISGTSAGAITAAFLAVGMTGKDILQRIVNNDFAKFWDVPMPGVYKTVKFDGTKNVPGYTTDSITSHEEAVAPGKQLIIDSVTSGVNFYPALAPALAAGLQNQDLMKRGITVLRLLKDGINLFNASKKIQQKSKMELLRTLTTGADGKPSDQKMFDYLYSEMMDRGLFTGEGIRQYLRAAFGQCLIQYFNVPLKLTGINSLDPTNLSSERVGQITFAELLRITGKELVITSTNITAGCPKLFSAKLTPDFPVVEAVCMSMSIPGVFKPTYVDALVNIAKGPNDDINKSYKGFYVDGGALNNIPIHVWDEAPDKPMNPAVFGICVNSGFDPNDLTYDSDPLWKSYIDAVNKAAAEKGLPAIPYKRVIESNMSYNGPTGSLQIKTDVDAFFSVLGGYAGDILNTLMYPAAGGQIRTPEEKAKLLDIYAYDIGVLDFTPDASLSAFVQQRAEQRMRAYFGL